MEYRTIERNGQMVDVDEFDRERPVFKSDLDIQKRVPFQEYPKVLALDGVTKIAKDAADEERLRKQGYRVAGEPEPVEKKGK